MLTTTRSAYLTKDELAQALGVSEALVRQWTRDGTIPARFIERQDDRSFQYARITVALGELMLELGRLFGQTSPLPKRIIPQLAQKLELLWYEPEIPARLTVTQGALEVRAPLAFLTTARGKLAAFA